MHTDMAARRPVASFVSNRWTQLCIGIACMALVANLQYGWTLFVNPMQAAHPDWVKASIQLAFSIFVVVETWLVPIEGWLVDRFGPRPVVAAGAVLVGAAWIMDSHATTLTMLYAAAVVAGLGAGCVYGTCVGNALKLFPDRRGLAAGLTAAGFGAGAALTVIPIANMIRNSGYQATFFAFALIQGFAIFLLALLLVRPQAPAHAKVTARVRSTSRDFSPREMVKTPVFWLLYFIFVAVAAGGLMATAQIGPIAKDYGVATEQFMIFGAMMPLLTLTLSVDNLANGLTRPLCGFLSDRIGRENTMFIVFLGEGLALLGLLHFGRDPVAFLIFAPLIFLFWGEIFSIFPAVCADTFGARNAAANAGTLYTAKGTASLLVPLASVLSRGGKWAAVFYFSAAICIVAALLARFLLKPMRERYLAAAPLPAAAAAPAGDD
ncbi:MAG TPA: oxalate/formate MFS antiporter [Usitatibacter sp.]|nr:oxalate/formate MFS antiporter [Usitatibacter sp.]